MNADGSSNDSYTVFLKQAINDAEEAEQAAKAVY